MTHPRDLLLLRRTVELRMDVVAALTLALGLFHHQGMGCGKRHRAGRR